MQFLRKRVPRSTPRKQTQAYGKKPGLWTGPVEGCPIVEPHPRRDCQQCKNAEMRRARAEGKWSPYNEKVRARTYVKVYLKRGKIHKTPCEVCGNPEVQAHHEDYSKPLQVRWLCRLHHLELHGLKARAA